MRGFEVTITKAITVRVLADDAGEDAERIADARRREVSNRGWAHKVYVGEAHEVR